MNAQLAPRTRLDSWKEIAAYLRRGTRTVQRWEHAEGLPVRRLRHDKLDSVYAFADEIDTWFAQRAAAGVSSSPARDVCRSIAVLPFADMSEEQDQGYFCDGLAEEIINTLGRLEGLKTASRTSSFRFRWPVGCCRDIGRQLGVAALLEGSVRKCGARLRISVQLIDAGSGFELWAGRYENALGDVFAAQDEIAADVAEALRSRYCVSSTVRASSRGGRLPVTVLPAVEPGRQIALST